MRVIRWWRATIDFKIVQLTTLDLYKINFLTPNALILSIIRRAKASQTQSIHHLVPFPSHVKCSQHLTSGKHNLSVAVVKNTRTDKDTVQNQILNNLFICVF